jgi:hypothetical protein
MFLRIMVHLLVSPTALFGVFVFPYLKALLYQKINL